MPEQSYANHRRFFPLFHFFAFPIIALNVIAAIVYVFRHPGWMNAWNVVVALALAALALSARNFAVGNQNRIIRLEERLRLAQILPADLRSRISELRTGDLIALRFCADEDLTDLTRAVLNGECKGRDEIKKRIKNWRPDYQRV